MNLPGGAMDSENFDPSAWQLLLSLMPRGDTSSRGNQVQLFTEGNPNPGYKPYQGTGNVPQYSFGQGTVPYLGFGGAPTRLPTNWTYVQGLGWTPYAVPVPPGQLPANLAGGGGGGAGPGGTGPGGGAPGSFAATQAAGFPGFSGAASPGFGDFASPWVISRF